MKSFTNRAISVAVAIFAIAFQPVMASDDVAAIKFGTMEITVVPSDDYDRATVTVKGAPGVVIHRDFRAEDALLVPLVADDGNALADGDYHIQAVFSSTAADGDGASVGVSNSVDSPFAIENGAIQVTSAQDGSGGPLAAAESEAAGTIVPSASNHFPGDVTITGNLCAGSSECSFNYFPSEDIQVIDSNPYIEFLDDNSLFRTFDWKIGSDSGGTFGITDRDNHSFNDDFSFEIHQGAPQNALVVDFDGTIGLGTSVPLATLHVTGPSPGNTSAKILVEEDSPFINGRTLLELKNHGPVQYFFNNTASGEVWQNSAFVGNFVIALTGTGGPEFQILSNGGMRVGPGPITNLDLDRFGNLSITGNFFANGVFYPSSREKKENFADIDTKKVLEKLAEMPIQRWNYKDDPATVTHIGPMSQDFAALFGSSMPAEKGINAMDATNVALAAIQGLYRVLEEKDTKIHSLEARLEALEAGTATR